MNKLKLWYPVYKTTTCIASSVMFCFLNLLYNLNFLVREVRIFMIFTAKSCFDSIDPVQNGEYDNLSPSDQRLLTE